MNPIQDYSGWKKLYEASENIYKKIERYYRDKNWSGLAEIIDDADNAVDDDEAHVQHVLLQLKSLDDFEALDAAMKKEYNMGVWARIDDFFEGGDFEKFDYNSVKAKVHGEWKTDRENKKKKEIDDASEESFEILKDEMCSADDDDITEHDYTEDLLYDFVFFADAKDSSGNPIMRYETDPEGTFYRFRFGPTGLKDTGNFSVERQQYGSRWEEILGGTWFPKNKSVTINRGLPEYKRVHSDVTSMTALSEAVFRRKSGSTDGDDSDEIIDRYAEKEWVGYII
jgi:hypothetical protein